MEEARLRHARETHILRRAARLRRARRGCRRGLRCCLRRRIASNSSARRLADQRPFRQQTRACDVVVRSERLCHTDGDRRLAAHRELEDRPLCCFSSDAQVILADAQVRQRRRRHRPELRAGTRQSAFREGHEGGVASRRRRDRRRGTHIFKVFKAHADAQPWAVGMLDEFLDQLVLAHGNLLQRSLALAPRLPRQLRGGQPLAAACFGQALLRHATPELLLLQPRLQLAPVAVQRHLRAGGERHRYPACRALPVQLLDVRLLPPLGRSQEAPQDCFVPAPL
mmetsp:Transcript_1552/g.4595  ORF Transcript_1552/g.4595 Transcript_1552/m.4595 type:complete len:282 (+) Transcript_1552:674-1519(+)